MIGGVLHFSNRVSLENLGAKITRKNVYFQFTQKTNNQLELNGINFEQTLEKKYFIKLKSLFNLLVINQSLRKHNLYNI